LGRSGRAGLKLFLDDHMDIGHFFKGKLLDIDGIKQAIRR
jgi:hypothetical protein